MNPAERSYGRTQVWLMGLCAVGMLLPVTMPVPVLRGLVQDRFGVAEFWSNLFMAINMIGAVLAAPLAGALADRHGRRREWIVVCLLVDAACFFGMTREVGIEAFFCLRLVEGMAHIAALSLLMSMAVQRADAAGERRGRVMGVMGAGITLGVALGAPLGGQLAGAPGQQDPLLPLQVGTGVLLVLALVIALFLRPPDVGVARRRPGLGEIAGLLRAERGLWIPLAYAFVDRFTVGFFTTTFTLSMKRLHELPPDEIGILLGLFLGPFALFSYPFGRLSERCSRLLLLAGGSLLYGLLVMSLMSWPLDLLPYVMVGLGLLSAVMFVPSLILTTELIPTRFAASAMGAFNAAGSLGFILGPVVAGAVVHVYGRSGDWATGYSRAFQVAGLVEVLCVLLTLRGLLVLRRQGRTA